MRVPECEVRDRVGIAARRQPVRPLIQVAPAYGPQHGVDQAGGSVPYLRPNEIDRRRDGRMCANAHGQQLMSAQPQHVENRGFNVGQSVIKAVADDRVVSAQAPERPVAEFCCESRVAS
jgi:hypothetical protein